MAEYKCEMCGGTMEVDQYATVATCEFCGAQRVLPQSVVADAENIRRDGVLNTARNKMQSNTIFECEQALRLLQSIAGWKNADELARQCRQKLEQLNAVAEKEQSEKKRRKELKKRKTIKTAKRVLISTVIICVVAFALTGLIAGLVVPYVEDCIEYKEAIEALEEGNYGGGIQRLLELGDFKDSAEKVFEFEMELLNNCEIGDTIYFGKQASETVSYSEEGIPWLVLDIQDGKVLVVSKYILSTGNYHNYNETVTWEDCDLRRWLNGDFMDEAFSEEEQELIVKAAVESQDYDGNPGNTTKDRIFLLSREETETYFKSADRRKCAEGVGWWLRDTEQDGAVYVTSDGYFDFRSDNWSDNRGIRPAMWIEIDP